MQTESVKIPLISERIIRNIKCGQLKDIRETVGPPDMIFWYYFILHSVIVSWIMFFVGLRSCIEGMSI